MAEVFTILDDGETLITGEWVPSPDDAAARLVALANSYDNLIGPLEEAKQIAIGSTQIHFDQKKDPQGVPWLELNSLYKDRKESKGGDPDEILVMSGAGKEAALNEDSYFITENEIWFNPGILPSAESDGANYMAIHQAGTANPVLGSALRKAISGEAFTGEEQQALNEGTGRGRALPQREWLGLDSFDIVLIEDIFNTWFASNLTEFFPESPGGTGLNMLGEFPIISYTKRGQPILKTPFGARFGRL